MGQKQKRRESQFPVRIEGAGPAVEKNDRSRFLKTDLKSAFLRNVNHQIRNPLNVILGNVELLMELVADTEGEAQRSLKTIAHAVIQLEQGLRAIIDISESETGTFRVVPTTIRISDLIQHQLFMIQPHAERKGIELLCEIEDPEIKVKVDCYCLSHALENLLDNALKYTENGHILVRVSVHPNRIVKIDVEDTGLGIDPTDIPKLFQPFSRRSTQPEEFGMGLGLALAKRYLALNGARLSVKSEKSRGSVFTIHLRIAYPPA
jgi:signal transduction histidine kinase